MLVIVLITLLAVASAWDVALHRIPNTLVVGVMSTGLFAQLVDGGWTALGSGVIAVPITAAALWVAWARSWIGGGDLKLAAATAAWLGLSRIPEYLLGSAIAVGALSLGCYAASARGARAEVRQNLALAMKGVPVAAPITAAAGRVQVPAGAGFAIAAVVVLATTRGL